MGLFPTTEQATVSVCWMNPSVMEWTNDTSQSEQLSQQQTQSPPTEAVQLSWWGE